MVLEVLGSLGAWVAVSVLVAWVWSWWRGGARRRRDDAVSRLLRSQLDATLLRDEALTCAIVHQCPAGPCWSYSQPTGWVELGSLPCTAAHS